MNDYPIELSVEAIEPKIVPIKQGYLVWLPDIVTDEAKRLGELELVQE